MIYTGIILIFTNNNYYNIFQTIHLIQVYFKGIKMTLIAKLATEFHH